MRKKLKMTHRRDTYPDELPFSMEADHITNAHNMADKNMVFGVKFNSAVLAGCGLWKYDRTPSFSKVTLDPDPSMTRQPKEIKRASILPHSILPLAFSGSRLFEGVTRPTQWKSSRTAFGIQGRPLPQPPSAEKQGTPQSSQHRQ